MDLDSIAGKVCRLTREVSSYILKEARSFDFTVVEEKGLNDLVSYVDKQAEKMLVNGLNDILPQAGFITEEGTKADGNEEYKWIIDPLDGTTNFTHGLPVFAISIALMKNTQLSIGVVHELNKNELFVAIEGQGAWCNDVPIKVSPRTSLSESLLATGFPYHNFEKMKQYLDILTAFMKGTHGLRRMGSAAVDLAYVACGRFEGFFEYNLNSWDVAAGALIVKEAGGEVMDFSGGDNFISGREIIAGCQVAKKMQLMIARHWS